jgi:type VI secretion system protein ImpL
LNAYTLKTVFDAVPLKDIHQTSGDYFLELIIQLKKAALSRAEVLCRQQSIKHYQELVGLFNKNLKGKFPFVGQDLRLTNAEVDPEDIREFFKKYDEFGGSPKEIINQVYQLGFDAAPALGFLQQLQDVKEFLRGFLQDSGADSVPSFDFSVDFRVNRQKETGGDMIVDWTLKPDEDNVINKNDKSRTGHWIYGNPVQISFRWPQSDSIPTRPVRDLSQPLLSVDEKTATFTFSAKWSLLWMLRLHMANKNEYTPLQDPNPHVLKFTIPLSGDEKAVVYDLLTLTLPPDNPKKSGKTVRMPDFPFNAPDLPETVLQYADQPVLAEGEIDDSHKDSSAEDKRKETSDKKQDDKADKKDDHAEKDAKHDDKSEKQDDKKDEKNAKKDDKDSKQ